MKFKNTICKKATEAEQNKVEHYVKRIAELIKNHIKKNQDK